MTLTTERFDEFFRAFFEYRNGSPMDPFPWQTRLANDLADDRWPDCIDLPTASGKTSVIDIAVFTLACQASQPVDKRTVGRRIFFTVNRRVIVDEAFDRSRDLAKALIKAEHENDPGILGEVARALRSVNEQQNKDMAPPLDIAQLRGGVYRDGAWARSLTQPMVVCTTADQLGSRLLFRGYGVSDGMKPIHAAFCACDSLVLLDEAHVTKAFSQTMHLLTKYQTLRSDKSASIHAMKFVQMTATPAGQINNRFSLDDADLANATLERRQKAGKPAVLVKLDNKKSIVGEVVTRATNALSDTRKAIGIIVNRIQAAREIHAKLAAKFPPEDVHLVIGRMRPLDRDTLQSQLRTLVGPDRPPVLDKPVLIVATQCLEVGADYDFDALITECASIDALRQRFGRLNRGGRPIEVIAAIVTNDEATKGEDPIYGDAIKHTWEWLLSQKDAADSVDFGIAAFKPLWADVEANRATYLDEKCPKPLLSPAPNAAVLLPAHLDALCQTNPQPVPSPDVSYFIHGPQRDNAEVNVCWRADLGDIKALWAEVVTMLPPTSPECMTVPLYALAKWMRQQKSVADADVAIASELETKEDNDKSPPDRDILIWRGKNDSFATARPDDLRPGDTVIIPAVEAYHDSLSLGHIPPRADGTIPFDIAEAAIAEARRQRIVRVHPTIHPDLNVELMNYARSDKLSLTRRQIRNLVGALAKDFTTGPEEMDYPHPEGSPKPGIVLRFNALLPQSDPLILPTADDDEEASSDSAKQVPLADHLADVGRQIRVTLAQLSPGQATTLGISADLHDLGKADLRFNAMLAGITPYEAIERKLLAKSGQRGLSQAERAEQARRAMLPQGFRHEMLSMQIVENFYDRLVPVGAVDRDLLLHLLGSHHGHARPFAPVVIDEAHDETRSVEVSGITVTPEQRRSWPPAHRLDSGVAERFWDLTRKHGWWGLAWLECILRLADQQASASDQTNKPEGVAK